MDAGGEGAGDLGGGDDGGERAAVADALGHGHDVGDDALGFETPVVRAGAAKAGLHLVGHAETAGGAGVGVGALKVTVREDDGAADALDGLGEEGGDAAAGAELDEVLHIVGVASAGVGVAGVGAAVAVGHERVVHAEAARDVVFPGVMGGEAHGGLAAAVVGVAQGEHVVVAGVGARHEQGEVVGLGAGVDEVNHFEVAGETSREVAGVESDVGVEVDGRRVLDERVLGVGGGGDVRVAMADGDGDDASEAVEVAAAGLVEEPLALALHDGEGLFVVMKNARVHVGVAQGEDLVGGRAGVGDG